MSLTPSLARSRLYPRWLCIREKITAKLNLALPSSPVRLVSYRLCTFNNNALIATATYGKNREMHAFPEKKSNNMVALDVTWCLGIDLHLCMQGARSSKNRIMYVCWISHSGDIWRVFGSVLLASCWRWFKRNNTGRVPCIRYVRLHRRCHITLWPCYCCS